MILIVAGFVQMISETTVAQVLLKTTFLRWNLPGFVQKISKTILATLDPLVEEEECQPMLQRRYELSQEMMMKQRCERQEEQEHWTDSWEKREIPLKWIDFVWFVRIAQVFVWRSSIVGVVELARVSVLVMKVSQMLDQAGETTMFRFLVKTKRLCLVQRRWFVRQEAPLPGTEAPPSRQTCESNQYKAASLVTNESR